MFRVPHLTLNHMRLPLIITAAMWYCSFNGSQHTCAQDIGAAIDVIRLPSAPRLPAATTKAAAADTAAISTATAAPGSTIAATAPSTATTCAEEMGSATDGVTVVCVKWGTKYGADYVNRLHRAVRRHLSAARSFVCLTDDPEGSKRGGIHASMECGLFLSSAHR